MARPRTNLLTEEVLFHGGAQLLTDADKLQPFQWRKIENMLLNELGAATKRRGTELLGTVGAAGDRVLSRHVFQRAGQTTQFIVHLSDGTVRYSTNLTSWTTMRSSLSTTSPMSFITFVDKVYMANGVDDYYQWDGTTGTAYASVPKFKYLESWKDGLWGAATTADPHIVYASDAGDGTVWGALSFVHIAKGSGPGISGLSSDASSLVIFKHLETHALYDPVEFINRVVDPEKGCLSHWGIVKHEGVIYFPSHRGICRYIGDAPSQIISDAIRPLFVDVVYDETLDTRWYSYVAEGRVGWCWPRDSVTDIWQVEYYPNLPDNPWIFHTIPARVIMSIKDPGAAEKIYGFGEGSNKTYRCFSPATAQDDGVDFTGTLESGWFDFKQPSIAKYLDRIIATIRGICQVSILIDLDDTTAVKNHEIGTPAGVLDEYYIYTDVYCRYVAIRITDGSSNTTTRRTPIGSEVESITEGSFAVLNMVLLAKPLGIDR